MTSGRHIRVDIPAQVAVEASENAVPGFWNAALMKWHRPKVMTRPSLESVSGVFETRKQRSARASSRVIGLSPTFSFATSVDVTEAQASKMHFDASVGATRVS